MKAFSKLAIEIVVVAACGLVGCSKTATQSPDVTSDIRKSLDQPPFKDVSVSQDRDKGVVTLNGHVASESDRSEAESPAVPSPGAK